MTFLICSVDFVLQVSSVRADVKIESGVPVTDPSLTPGLVSSTCSTASILLNKIKFFSDNAVATFME